MGKAATSLVNARLHKFGGFCLVKMVRGGGKVLSGSLKSEEPEASIVPDWIFGLSGLRFYDH